MPQEAQKQKKQWTQFHVSEARVQHWSRQAKKNRDQNTSLKKEQTSVCEATLTDVLNTQLKDHKQDRLVNVSDHRDVAVFSESSRIFTRSITCC